MALRLSRSLLDRLLAEAARSRDEICGLLFGDGDIIAEARACANVAADPAFAFEVDPAALVDAYRAARSGGPRLIGVYHSHPGGCADPSPRDAAAAAPDHWLWLILGDDRALLWRAVPRGAVHGRFDPVAFDTDAIIANPGEPPA